jgi:hypothetical protein
LRRQLREWSDAPGCDSKTYLALYPDLLGRVNEKTAYEHYQRYGRAAGRDCSFDWKGYVALNPDLGRKQRSAQGAWQHYIKWGRAEGRSWRSPAGFEWLAYLETNADLLQAHIGTQGAATHHYLVAGRKEGRNCKAVYPVRDTYTAAVDKFQTFSQASTASVEKRNLIIYHIEDIGSNDNAYDLTVNNLKIFLAALLHHAESHHADQQAFYWFNVAALTDNPMKALLPTHLPNVAAVDWIYSSSAFNSFIHTLNKLSAATLSSVGAVFSLSTGVRGPLLQHEDGGWISEYRKVLDANNVGLVGPVISCEGSPHVQNHMFAVRVAAVSAVLQQLEHYKKISKFVSIEDYFQEHLSAAVISAKFRIASLRDVRRMHKAYFTGTCPAAAGSSSSACHVDAKDALFLRWSGESLGAKGFVCGKGIAMTERSAEEVRGYTAAVASTQLPSGQQLPANLLPVLPEARTGWQMHEEFNREASLKPTPAPKMPLADHVCFWVQVDRSQDWTLTGHSAHKDGTVVKHVQDLLRSKYMHN